MPEIVTVVEEVTVVSEDGTIEVVEVGIVGDPGPPGTPGPGYDLFDPQYDDDDEIEGFTPNVPMFLDFNRLFLNGYGDDMHALGWGYLTDGIDGPVLSGFAGFGLKSGDDMIVAADGNSLYLPQESAADDDEFLTVDDQGRVGHVTAETARQNLGLGTMATASASDYLSKAGNLSGIADPAVARTNLGLGSMATQTANAYAALTGATFTGAVTVNAAATSSLTAPTTADNARLYLDGGTATGKGAIIGFFRGGGLGGWVGSNSAGNGGASSGITLASYGGALSLQHGNYVVGVLDATSNRFVAQAATTTALVARMAPAQTAAGVEVQNSSGSVLASISAAGAGTFTGITASGSSGLTVSGGLSYLRPSGAGGNALWIRGQASQGAYLVNFQDNTGATLGGIGPTAEFYTPGSTSARAGLRIPHGTAPSAPTDGDIWTTTAGAYIRVNGVTKQIQFV
ncbi:MAG: hypothetical protein WC054_02790 [Candidatus Nanopelagicales bacterium]